MHHSHSHRADASAALPWPWQELKGQTEAYKSERASAAGTPKAEGRRSVPGSPTLQGKSGSAEESLSKGGREEGAEGPDVDAMKVRLSQLQVDAMGLPRGERKAMKAEIQRLEAQIREAEAQAR